MVWIKAVQAVFMPVGITPELAIKITESDYKLSSLHCFSNLQHGIYHALAEQGSKVL
ncbi:hypothetical protein ACQYAD_08740 [Neobacillus sp. SM06]|uniref:hypothetical protein n=1 Tax=Neobacillus sp. SM06 TaxID=3422492 RepID=UPI003D26B8FD